MEKASSVLRWASSKF